MSKHSRKRRRKRPGVSRVGLGCASVALGGAAHLQPGHMRPSTDKGTRPRPCCRVPTRSLLADGLQTGAGAWRWVVGLRMSERSRFGPEGRSGLRENGDHVNRSRTLG